MKIKSFTKKAICVALLAGASLSANAGEKNLATLSIGTTNFNNSDILVHSTTFADAIYFSLPTNGGSSYGVLNYPLNLSSVDPTLVFDTLFSYVAVRGAGVDGKLGTIDDVRLAGGEVTPASPSFNFTLPGNSGGDYYLFISGMAPIGAYGSLYSGSITVSPVPVPEPESYAMFLAGLGLMGVIVRRRMRSQS